MGKKLLILFIVILYFVNIGFSQEKDSLVYSPNFEYAKETALQENKDILLVFSGSDWCKPCVVLDKTILQDSVFVVFANENLKVYKADFPRKKKNKLSKEQEEYNDILASKYNKNGEFPKVLLFSPNLELKATLIYNNMSAENFINQIKKF